MPFDLKMMAFPIAALVLLMASNVGGSPAPYTTSHGGPISGNVTSCCAILQHALGDKVSFPGHVNYEVQQSGTSNDAGYWSLQEAELYPACRITPTCASEVGETVRFLGEAQCKFAVRGGGHTSWAGAANIDGHGLTIDLSAFNSVSVFEDQTLVSVGGGCRWIDVYMVLDAMGLAVSGGRVGMVGVAGLTLGGGKSFFQSIHGFACDAVRNFELITGEGTVLQVNQSSYPDLFKALKGGSNNFGIVTRFDLNAFQQGHLWGGQVVYPVSTASQQYSAFYNMVESETQVDNVTSDAQIIFAYVTTSAGQFFANEYTYTIPQAWPSQLSGFEAIEPRLESTLRISNLSDFTIELGTGTPNGFRYLFGTLTFENNLDFFLDLKNISDTVFNPLFEENKVPGLVLSVVLQPLTGAMLAKGCGSNSLGLCPGAHNLVFLDLTVQWTYAANDSIVHNAANNLINQATDRAERMGVLNQYLYLNYALERQNPIASYGESNLVNLRAVSTKYDRGQIFQSLVQGGFKLYR